MGIKFHQIEIEIYLAENGALTGILRYRIPWGRHIASYIIKDVTSVIKLMGGELKHFRQLKNATIFLKSKSFRSSAQCFIFFENVFEAVKMKYSYLLKRYLQNG